MSNAVNIEEILNEALETNLAVRGNPSITEALGSAVECIVSAYRNGGKVLFCGNGGSAADAQHIAAELSGRFHFDRPGLYAEALHCNSSYITAVSNDYSYDIVYERLIKAMGREGDVLVGISTSGNSKNVLKALKTANALGIHTIAMVGGNGGELGKIGKIVLASPSNSTPRVQEIHILYGHIICELVEKILFRD